MERTKTKQVKIGNTFLGGNNHILIQSMCNIKTSKVDEVVKLVLAHCRCVLAFKYRGSKVEHAAARIVLLYLYAYRLYEVCFANTGRSEE